MAILEFTDAWRPIAMAKDNHQLLLLAFAADIERDANCGDVRWIYRLGDKATGIKYGYTHYQIIEPPSIL